MGDFSVETIAKTIVHILNLVKIHEPIMLRCWVIFPTVVNDNNYRVLIIKTYMVTWKSNKWNSSKKCNLFEMSKRFWVNL